jgi:ubiquitin carboxyl-terminal hydrolase 8
VAYAFGMPDFFDEEPEQGLAVVSLTCGSAKLCDPIVMRAPLNSPADVALLVQNRIESLVEPAFLRDVRSRMKLITAPERFTAFPGSRGCRESVVVDIPQGGRALRPRQRVAQGPITLIELLNAFFLRSQLDADNQWRCEHCRQDSCAFREARLVRAPPNLIVQLKRFSGRNRVSRNDTPVAIGELIDISHVAADRSAVYEVRAIVHHTGTLSSGHYTAACRRANCWFAFNDKIVTEREGPGGRATESAYLVFLSKVAA